MGRQVDPAVPGEKRPTNAPNRHSVEASIGEGNRLDDYWRDRSPTAARRANNALLNGSTRFPSPLVPSGNRMSASPLANLAPMASRWAAVLRTCRSTKTLRCNLASQPKNGHRATSQFGDKGAGYHGAEHRYVGVGDVICRKQHRAFAGRCSDHSNSKPEDSTAPAVIENRQRARPTAAQGQPDQLNRHQASGPSEIEREASKPQRRRTHVLKRSMYLWTAVRSGGSISRSRDRF